MTRTLTVEYASQPGIFTPLQIQPRELFAEAIHVKWRWLKEHVGSLRQFVDEQHMNWVIVGAHIAYQEPFNATTGDGFAVTLHDVKLRRDGSMIDLRYAITSGALAVAAVRVIAVIVQFTDESMGGHPGKIEGPFLQRFTAAEREETRQPRVMPVLLEQIEKNQPVIAEGKHPLFMYRHLCEVADMWSFIEIPRLVSEARERLILSGGGADTLTRGLRLPLRSLDLELRHPFYLFDEGRIETRCHASGPETAFVHRFYGTGQDALRATLVERFAEK